MAILLLIISLLWAWALTCCGPHPSSLIAASHTIIITHSWLEFHHKFFPWFGRPKARPSAHLPAQIETRNLNACIKSFQRICSEQTDRLQRPSDTIRYLVLCVYNLVTAPAPHWSGAHILASDWSPLVTTCFEPHQRTEIVTFITRGKRSMLSLKLDRPNFLNY